MEEEESDNEIANLCLMAQEDNEVCTSNSYEIDESYEDFDELKEAFLELLNESKTLGAKYKLLKKQLGIASVEKENLEKTCKVLQDENKELKATYKMLKETFEKEKNELVSKHDNIVNMKAKSFSSTKRLYDYVDSIRSHKEYTGIGYNSLYFNRNYATNDEDKESSTTNVQIAQVKTFRRPSLTCSYCCRNGHHVSRCFVKRDVLRNNSKWRWVVKGSKVQTNKEGPNRVWVPKTKN